jgi:acetyl esterase/lipase
MPLMPAERRSRLPACARHPAALRSVALAALLACAAALVLDLAPGRQVVAAGSVPAGGAGVSLHDPAAAPGPGSTTGPDGLEPPRSPRPDPRPRNRVDRDVRYRGAYGPALDIHHPTRDPARLAPAVLVVHGGAWRSGDKSALSHLARSLAAAGFVAVNVNYTLAAPGRPGFPIQLEELRAAFRWIRARASELRIDPARIGAVGSSAGAHLVSLLATTGRGPLTSGRRLRAVVAWSAPFDLAPAHMGVLRGHVAGFVGCHKCRRRRAAASPIAHVTADDPAMLIVNSRHEMIRVSQARRMASRLRSAGVRRQLRILRGTLHAPRYSPSVLGPTIAFLERRLR